MGFIACTCLLRGCLHEPFIARVFSTNPTVPHTTVRTKEKRIDFSILLTWSGKRDSNSRPQPWQGCALPTELFPHFDNFRCPLFLKTTFRFPHFKRPLERAISLDCGAKVEKKNYSAKLFRKNSADIRARNGFARKESVARNKNRLRNFDNIIFVFIFALPKIRSASC